MKPQNIAEIGYETSKKYGKVTIYKIHAKNQFSYPIYNENGQKLEGFASEIFQELLGPREYTSGREWITRRYGKEYFREKNS